MAELLAAEGDFEDAGLFDEDELQAESTVSEEERVAGSSAPEWVGDEEVTECQGCLRVFTVTFRRHHCRGCGKIYCDECSSQSSLMPPSFGLRDGPKRVCDRCAKVFFPYEPLLALTSAGHQIEFGRVGQGEEIVMIFHGSIGDYTGGLAAAYSWTLKSSTSATR